jgi:hypothetical protein
MKAHFLSILLLICASILHAAAPAPVPGANADLARRAEKLIMPEVEFHEATVPEIVTFLNKATKDLDPLKIGVPLELSPAALAEAKNTRITLTLKNVPVIEVIKYVTNLGNLRYAIEKDKVLISPLGK